MIHQLKKNAKSGKSTEIDETQKNAKSETELEKHGRTAGLEPASAFGILKSAFRSIVRGPPSQVPKSKPSDSWDSQASPELSQGVS